VAVQEGTPSVSGGSVKQIENVGWQVPEGKSIPVSALVAEQTGGGYITLGSTTIKKK